LFKILIGWISVFICCFQIIEKGLMSNGSSIIRL
jgi:hypothetical protein